MILSAMVFFPFAIAADAGELLTMRNAVMAAGEDWPAIEAFLDTLSPEDREYAIKTYPERLAELQEVKLLINESGANWTAGLNPIALLPPEKQPRMGSLPLPEEEEIVMVGPSKEEAEPLALPTSWDWRNAYGYDWTTPIKNQNPCGSCVAFGTLAAIESRIKIAADNPSLNPDFSEQYLISDCTTFLNCIDGWYISAGADWMTCEGTVDEACFPYQAVDTTQCYDSCFDRNSRFYTIEGWNWVCDSPSVVDVDRIKQEIISGGPIACRMRVYEDFIYYNSGIYQYQWGNYLGGHCVNIVGWGTSGGTNYWICKNSWGTTSWGTLGGWFLIKMGEVEIGTQAAAHQPKVRGKVLFYEGHVPMGDFRLSSGYSEWGNILASNGYLVHSTTENPLTANILNCYDVVIIANPSTSFSSTERGAIKDFVGQGRVIASGDGNLFYDNSIYLQDNERIAVEYVDWLASGEGGGLLVMGEWGGFSTNTAANQVANLFGLKFNQDEIIDTKRYDTNTDWPILGPKDDVEVKASCSLDISKDATVLARATSSGYTSAAFDSGSSSADGDAVEGDLGPEKISHVEESLEMEIDITPEELELTVMAAEEMPSPSDDLGAEIDGGGLEPGDMPPVGKMLPEGELTAPDEEVQVAFSPVPLAGLAFAGPIGIAAVDFGRKGEDTMGVFRPSTRKWYLDYDNNGVPDKVFAFGLNGDLAVSGDWNGDGKDTVGVFRPSTRTWYLDYDNNGVPDKVFAFGLNGDLAVSGDWNGDGKDTVGVFRPTTRTWYLDYDNNGVPDKVFAFGLNGDLAVSGDWNGDGRDTVGVFRPTTRTWYLDYDNNGVPDKVFAFGLNGDLAVSGDWNGDGRDTVGVFRPTTRTWYLDYDNDRVPDKILAYGLNGDIPVFGDWFKN